MLSSGTTVASSSIAAGLSSDGAGSAPTVDARSTLARVSGRTVETETVEGAAAAEAGPSVAERRTEAGGEAGLGTSAALRVRLVEVRTVWTEGAVRGGDRGWCEARGTRLYPDGGLVSCSARTVEAVAICADRAGSKARREGDSSPRESASSVYADAGLSIARGVTWLGDRTLLPRPVVCESELVRRRTVTVE